MRAVTTVALVCVCGLFLCSCAGINSNVPFQYQPSLVDGKTIDMKAGVNMLVDNRPESDRENTSAINDLAEKVTAKVIEDLDESRIYKEIHFRPAVGDGVEISGSIERFSWNLRTNPLAYVPVLDLLMFFGMPVYRVAGMTEISLQVQDKATGVRKTYVGSSQVANSHSIYKFKAGEAGSELAESFRESMKMIKNQIEGGTTDAVAQGSDANANAPVTARRVISDIRSDFSLHLLANNPMYTISYPGSSGLVGKDHGVMGISGIQNESAPGFVGGAGLRFSPWKKFFLNFNVYDQQTLRGTVRNQLTYTGFGTKTIDFQTVMSQGYSYGLDLDYLLYQRNRMRFYVGGGYLRSSFQLQLRSSYPGMNVNYLDSNVNTYLSSFAAADTAKMDVSLLSFNTGAEWMLTDTVSFSLMAYIPFSRNPASTTMDMPFTEAFMEAHKSGAYYYVTDSSYDTVSRKIIELNTPPAVLNAQLSYFFY